MIGCHANLFSAAHPNNRKGQAVSLRLCSLVLSNFRRVASNERQSYPILGSLSVLQHAILQAFTNGTGGDQSARI